MTIKLYGMAQSRSFRTLWALEESGLNYEYVPIKLFADSNDPDSIQSKGYLELNVEGKVPTLVDGDLVITESAAIVNHVGRRAPESGLMPLNDVDLMARYDQMLFFIVTELEQPLWSNGKHRFALPEDQRIPQMLETANFEFAKAVTTLDHLMQDHEYAIGDQFTMIDIVLAHTISWATRFRFDVPEKYLSLKERHYARPAAVHCLGLVEQ